MRARLGVLFLVLLLSLASGLLTGCFGGDDDDGGSAPASSQGEAEDGGTLRIGVSTELESVNPFKDPTFEGMILARAAYPSLLMYNGDLDFASGLAESWDVSEDGLVWTYKLTPGKWSDGKPITADDVVFTLDSLIKYKDGALGALGFLVDGISKVEATDENTVVVTYDKPVAAASDLIGRVAIVPKHIWAPHEGSDGKGLVEFNPGENLPMVSAGPYIPTKYEPRGTSVLEKNPDYPGKVKPHADTIVIQSFTNPDALAQALLGGQLDYVRDVPGQAVKAVDGKGGLRVDETDGFETFNIRVNGYEDTKKPEFRDAEVRKAIDLAIDRQEIVDVVLAGHGEPAGSYLAAYSSWHNPDIEPTAFDVEEANRILDDAGYKKGSDGVRVTPDGAKMDYELLIQSDLTGANRLAEILKSGFDQVGIKVTPKLLDFVAVDELLQKRDYDLQVWSNFTSPDPAYLNSVSLCDGPYNGGFCSKEYDRLAKQEGKATDPDKRRELDYQMQQLVFDAKYVDEIATKAVVSGISDAWDGFLPLLMGRSNYYLTSPHKVSN